MNFSIVRLLLLIAPLFTVFSGCSSIRGGEAPEYYLQPAGWYTPEKDWQAESFSEYTKAVKRRVEEYRVPFEVTQKDDEAKLVSPRQFDPAEHCKSNGAKGIVILVHGLSDTAFAMQDLARFFASKCYIARTVLLPGHGTRAGDLLVVRLHHWLQTVRYLTEQAASEHDHVLLGGFSLGAVLTLSVALEDSSPVDGVLAFSPAYSLSSWRLARFAPWLFWAKSWIDRGLPDDYARYEAMPTRGVAETVKAMRRLSAQLKKRDVEIPWLVAQSLDDAVTVPDKNTALFKTNARHSNSRMINFFSDQPVVEDPQTTWLPGNSDEMRVLGITHLGVHIDSDNPHYGPDGDYRNCGQTAGRDSLEVEACLASDRVWYGLWDKPDPPGMVAARSSFNPNFVGLTNEISDFLDRF